MKRNTERTIVFLLIISAVFVFCACGGDGGTSGGGGGGRNTNTSYLSPSADGSETYTSAGIILDASNSSEGYIMVKYTGSASKIKIQITGPSGETYTYTDTSNEYETFPITEGNGSYKVDILENVSGTMYTLNLSQKLNVSIDNEFTPFLYPNQYVWYTSDCDTVAKGCELSDNSSDDLGYVENVYKYVIKNVSYDTAKASNVPLDYVPDIDETLSTGKGICFDYASLMSAMLRSQGVPTKLVVGYSGAAYHAWISVWLEETGWVDNIIEFDGKDWSLMDPTLASSNDSSAVGQYIGDGSNYVVKYNY